MPEDDPVNRRSFVKGAAAVGAALGAAGKVWPKSAPRGGRVIGANDRINVAVIGGSRGAQDARTLERVAQTSNAQIIAVCDLYGKRKQLLVDRHKCDGYLDYREALNRSDVDAVVIAAPDHWHARMALEAMDRGKDVYVEKPMTHTIPEARQLVAKVKETKRVLQVGSQTTSGTQWAAAKKAIAEGAIGHMIMSQGSYHRNSKDGEWNYVSNKEGLMQFWTAKAKTISTGTRGLKTPPSGPSTPTVSFVSASTGITPAGSPRTCSFM